MVLKKCLLNNNNNNNNYYYYYYYYLYKDKEAPDDCNIKVKCNKIEKGKLYSSSHVFKFVNINIGKYLLRLIDKHFNQYNILHKIFKRKTLKISYSCTNNFLEIINIHNTEVIRKY